MNQHEPNTVKVEMTEGCNLRCGMCGIQGIREKAGGPYSFMPVEMAQQIAVKMATAGWRSKIEFTLRGEPLMNPNAAAIVAAFRKELPRQHIMITSNAIPLLRGGVHKNVGELFEAGLNILALDAYRNSAKAIEQVRQINSIPIHDYNESGEGRSPYKRVKAKEQFIVIIQDFETAVMGGAKVGTKIGNNHCGAGMPYTAAPLAKRCARPFRELTVRWDGNVMLCCNDWRGVYKCGNISDYETIDELWNNAAFLAARKKLYHRDRDFGACKGCDNTSFRVGLLPDPGGKDELPVAGKKDEEAIERAVAGGPYTRPVLRPWEIF